MTDSNPKFRPNEQSGMRSRLTFPCCLHLPDQDIEAVTSSVSYGGIGIELFLGTEKFIPEFLTAVTVEGIGEFGVEARWRNGCSLGVEFTDREKACHLLQALLQNSDR